MKGNEERGMVSSDHGKEGVMTKRRESPLTGSSPPDGGAVSSSQDVVNVKDCAQGPISPVPLLRWSGLPYGGTGSVGETNVILATNLLQRLPVLKVMIILR